MSEHTHEAPPLRKALSPNPAAQMINVIGKVSLRKVECDQVYLDDFSSYLSIDYEV